MPRHRRPGRPRKYKAFAERAVEVNPEAARGIVAVILSLIGGLLLLSYIGLAGSVGRFLHDITRLIFGWPTYLLPIILLSLAWRMFKQPKEEESEEAGVKLSTYVGTFLFFLFLPALIHIFVGRGAAVEIAQHGGGGGMVGYGVSYIFLQTVDLWASVLILTGLTLISLIMMTNTSITALWQQTKNIFISPRPEGERVNFAEEKPKESWWKKFLGWFSYPRKPKRQLPEKPLPQTDTAWPLPTVDLLEDKVTKPSPGNIDKNVKAIQKSLADFNIKVTMGEVNVGPTVTQYTLKPDTGVKLNQITARANDLALALAAHPIRIEAPIPGRSAAGIEVPNKVPALVRLREMISTTEFNSLRSKLGFMLGRDVSGQPISADLEKMPHLLIAGATGSGKTICINSIILTLLFRNSPADLKFLMVDPKRVELIAYNNVPHLLAPVITDVEQTISALRWAVAEMERRYKVFQETNKRNIDVYNMTAKEKMPYIIVIVDELADLMAAAPREVEGSIVRLSQMARATGLHLIVATQRPSVDVITGLIKANITSRIAFAVASQVDSRTILDQAGAEKLLGNGDMLYLASDVGKPKRIQGIFVSDKEIKAVANFLRQKGKAQYVEEVLKFRPVRTEKFRELPDDELFNDAVEVVVRAKKASSSLLQRRLRVGYARAARLLDLLEDRGVVGPGEGSKPRDVLVDEGGKYEFEDH